MSGRTRRRVGGAVMVVIHGLALARRVGAAGRPEAAAGLMVFEAGRPIAAVCEHGRSPRATREASGPVGAAGRDTSENILTK